MGERRFREALRARESGRIGTLRTLRDRYFCNKSMRELAPGRDAACRYLTESEAPPSRRGSVGHGLSLSQLREALGLNQANFG